MRIALSDLDYILKKMGNDLLLLKNANIFITGGTGFIGKWLLESIIYSNEKLNLNIKATVLTRNPQKFISNYPHLGLNPLINFISGDIRDFVYPENNYNFIIHAATEASAKLNVENPLLMTDVIVNGTKHVLDFARQCEVQKLLFISSGAVYGKQPDDLSGFSEDYIGAPNPLEPGNSYGLSKRMAEFLCSTYSQLYNIHSMIARCFAFVGPYLSLDEHYAVGNFINDGINNRDIIISGDGKPLRSYMYSADLIIWLWTILLKGKCGEAYNVGSEQAVTINALAQKIVKYFPGIGIKILNQVKMTDRYQNYVPNIQKAKVQLYLNEGIELDEALLRTIKFNLPK